LSAVRVDLLPQDQDARDRIRHELGTTLFVEAGAGSGKTTALIDRVLALVVDGVELRSIAAITFTEKAGAELRDRIRARLERETGADDLMIAERCRQALDQLDSAAIGTLHSFAQRLLTENPVEAGLPPAVEVADEVTSALAFDRRWSVFLESLLADRALARTLLLLTAAGVRPEALRVLAMAFDDNWDLVDERVPSTAPEPPVITDLIASALDALDAVCARTAECAVAVDRLVVRLDELRAYGLRLRAASDEFEVLEALNPSGTPRPPSFNVGGVGVKTRWVDADDVRARVEGVHDQLLSARSAVVEGCAARVGAAIRRFTIGAAAERRRDGLLDFHDLLVLARSLLRQTAVRVRLHERYRRILLDEFQDTDPIQIELAVRIAAADPASPDAGSLPWDQVAVAPGHLFIVGDPKQSI
jgi:ATP-dependent helicase/nuclease subunit A